MKNYTHWDAGKLQDLSQYSFSPEAMDISISGKLFLKDRLNLTSMEVSLNKDLPNTGTNFYHRHKNNEELYIFIGGQGQMAIDDQIFSVSEGSVVSIQPQAARSLWNTGDEPLYYIVIQAPFGKIDETTLNDGEIVSKAAPWHNQ